VVRFILPGCYLKSIELHWMVLSGCSRCALVQSYPGHLFERKRHQQRPRGEAANHALWGVASPWLIPDMSLKCFWGNSCCLQDRYRTQLRLANESTWGSVSSATYSLTPNDSAGKSTKVGMDRSSFSPCAGAANGLPMPLRPQPVRQVKNIAVS